jgi:hypothetical protein
MEMDSAPRAARAATKKILGSGFDYVTEKNGIMLFRRPKRFSKYAS